MARHKKLYEEKGFGFYDPNTRIETVFFGGGTPSLIEPDYIEKLLELLNSYFSLSSDCEITLESNPGTLTKETLEDLNKAGINRLSLGVQSFQDQFLKPFGRIHTGDEAFRTLQLAKEVNFRDVSADLIFGFPNQSLKQWQNDLMKAHELQLNHLSCYQLTAEEGTVYGRDLKQGTMQPLEDDLLYDMMNWTYDFNEQNGLSVYEVSNFAKPGFESRHNKAYWAYESFLGFGPSATGQTFYKDVNANWTGLRWRTTKRLDVFLQSDENQPLLKENLIDDQETLTQEGTIFENLSSLVLFKEALMMGLRAKNGFDFQTWSKRLNLQTEVLPTKLVLDSYVAKGLLTLLHGVYQPTRQGYFQNAQIVRDCL